MPYVYKVDEEGNGYYDYEVDDIGFETSDPNKLYGIEAGYAFDPEAPGFQKYVDDDKNEVVIAPDGSYFLNGKKIWSPPKSGRPSADDWGELATKLGNWATSPKGAAAIAATAYQLASGANKPQTGGWKGSIPKLTSVREQVEMPAYEPYSGKAVMGGKFFTDPQYVSKTDTAGITAAQDAAKAEAARLKGINPTAPAAAVGTKFADNTLTKKQDMSGLRDIYLMPGMGLGNKPPVSAEPAKSPIVQANSTLNNMPEMFDEVRRLLNPNLQNIQVDTSNEMTKTRTGLGGGAAPPGYYFGPADELVPDSVNTIEQYDKWRQSQQSGQSGIASPAPAQKAESGQVVQGNVGDTGPGFMPMPISSGGIPAGLEEAMSNKPAPVDQSGIATLKENTKPRFTMEDVKAANPQLDWSKYQPPGVDSMGPMIYTDFDEARDRYLRNLSGNAQPEMQLAAQGGLMNLAKGRYLAGPTDGMADKIPSSIDGKQPAKLSHGEFVIPADVVSHLGNGNSEAGANQLYKMMDRVRKARTGSTKQGKKINPDRFTPGGIAGYASGGAVAFQAGGGTDTALSRAATANPNLGATQETNLAPWVGDYTADFLGRAQAIGNEGYQAFQGPLSAGTSPLQQQAFTSAGQINPQATFDTAAAQQYMNPFIQTALQPQLEEMRRQAEISRLNTAGRLSKAGAFGGGRQAIMESELLRNLGQQQALTTGKAYETAFDKAMGQYNTSRQQQLQDVGALAGLGAQQRQIEQQGIDQLRAEFEKQRQFPMEQVKFQRDMLAGLPIGSTTVTPNTSAISNLGLSARQTGMLMDWLNENVFNKP